MHWMERRLAGAARVTALIGFFGLLLLAGMTTLDVILRWLFQAPIHGVNDVSSVVMAVVIAACIPANLAMKQNITVEVFGNIAGPRVQQALAAFASFLTLIFIALIAWRFVPFTQGLHDTGDRTWVLGWPIWPWWLVSTVLMIFSMVVQAMVTAADLVALFAGAPASADAGHETPGSTDSVL